MPRIPIFLNDDQLAHVQKLAEKADCDDAVIVRSLVQADMEGAKPAERDWKEIAKEMVEAYNRGEDPGKKFEEEHVKNQHSRDKGASKITGAHAKKAVAMFKSNMSFKAIAKALTNDNCHVTDMTVARFLRR